MVPRWVEWIGVALALWPFIAIVCINGWKAMAAAAGVIGLISAGWYFLVPAQPKYVPVGFLEETRTFGGYECTNDCTGHAAGYRWAAENPHRLDECGRGGPSFFEGCRVYTDEPYRGAEEDDQGEVIEE
ncbi:hypothetical protein [Ancylobacter terrae]|uniref:hypothetical protein n=1 Tax=Ancylobacter sp. sgz301288 TaxID=3342077 RepID=UPI00385C5FE8